jgi:ankyrin repeat protein
VTPLTEEYFTGSVPFPSFEDSTGQMQHVSTPIISFDPMRNIQEHAAATFMVSPMFNDLPFVDLSTTLDPQFWPTASVASQQSRLDTFLLLDKLEYTILPIAKKIIRDLHRPINPSTFPLQVLCSPNTSSILSTRAPDLRIVYMIIFALCNNLVDLENLNDPASPMDELYQKVIRHFNGLPKRHFAQILDSFQQPMRQALMLGLFRAAVELGASKVVDTLLDRGLDPSQVMLQVRGHQYSPLARACYNASVDVVRSLLSHEAGTESVLHSSTIQSCLPHYLKSYHVIPSARLEILEMLLQNGGQLAKDANFCRIGWGGLEEPCVYYIVVKHINGPHHDALMKRRVMETLVKVGENRIVTSLLKDILFKAGNDTIMDERWRMTLRDCLAYAAFRKNTESFNALLDAGAVSDSFVLAKAVQGENLPVIEHLLDTGTSATQFSMRQSIGLSYPISHEVKALIPIAEAIRSPSAEVRAAFWNRGLLVHLQGNGPAIKHSISAACDIGDKSTLDHCLNLWVDYSESCDPSHGDYIYENNHFFWSNALHACIRAGRSDMVEKLLGAGMSPDLADLDLALETKNKLLIMLLLEAVPNIRHKCKSLHLAVQSKSLDILKYLVAAGMPLTYLVESTEPSIKHGRCSLLTTALLSEDERVIKLCLKINAPIEVTNEDEFFCPPSSAYIVFETSVLSPLYAAVHTKNISIAEELISRGVNPFDNLALLEASSTGDLHTTRFLLTATESWHARFRKGFGAEALIDAVQRGDLGMLGILLPYTDANHLDFSRKDSYPVDKPCRSAFGAAIANETNKSLHMLQMFLEHGADPNSIVSFGRPRSPKSQYETALMHAISTGQLSKVQFLIGAGASISTPATLGKSRTPLQLATELGALHIVGYLLDQGADPNELPAIREGRTSLQLAAGKGYIGVAHLLLGRGADVNAPACLMFGCTAIENAAKNGRIDMLVFLEQNEADIVRDGDKQYKRAVKFAKSNGHLAVVHLLESWFAKACNIAGIAIMSSFDEAGG